MPRVHHRKARKDYPKEGIKRGEQYYYWKMKTGPYSSYVGRQKTYPHPSQLTTSDFLGRVGDMAQDMSEISSADDIQPFIDDLTSLGEEQTEKRENMPEGLQESDSGTLLEERAQACETACEELDEIKDRVENHEGERPTDEDSDEFNEWNDAYEELLDEARNVSVDS